MLSAVKRPFHPRMHVCITPKNNLIQTIEANSEQTPGWKRGWRTEDSTGDVDRAVERGGGTTRSGTGPLIQEAQRLDRKMLRGGGQGGEGCRQEN